MNNTDWNLNFMEVITYKPVKRILISAKKDVFISKNLCRFSTDKIARMLPNCPTRNWKRGTGSECTAII